MFKYMNVQISVNMYTNACVFLIPPVRRLKALSAMLPIFLLAAVFTFQLATSSILPSLIYYDAIRDKHIYQEWYNMVKNPLDERTSMIQLINEANDLTGKTGTQMTYFLQQAKPWQSCTGLTAAECLVVGMYQGYFYGEYNQATRNRNWKPYRVFTTLMMSALRKLSKIHPIPPGMTLYRGINFKASPPTSKRIVWWAFTSTSLNIEVAKGFAGHNGMILKFKPPSSRFAAKVSDYEVILFPFEAFDFLFVDSWGGFNFQTSRNLNLLTPPYCPTNSLEWACFRKGLCNGIAC